MTQRMICPECEYIMARCLCSTLKTIENHTHIIILQHPSETNHALNTVNIMRKCFQKITIFIGEDFSDHIELNSLLKNHSESVALIFPSQEKRPLSRKQKTLTHLLFIDGTWKKARKIYLLSKNLKHLPTYSLELTSTSQYKIRSSSLDNSLSTLEATVSALKIVENQLDTQSATDSFQKMIQFQIEMMGEDTYKKNYSESDD